MGPVAEMMFRGWPENSEYIIPPTAPANMHSIVAFKWEISISSIQIYLFQIQPKLNC